MIKLKIFFSFGHQVIFRENSVVDWENRDLAENWESPGETAGDLRGLHLMQLSITAQ